METQINEISRVQSIIEVLEEYLLGSDNVDNNIVSDCIMQVRIDLARIECELDELNVK